MPAIGARRVGVIGAGMVGVCAACWLQRDGHSVFLIESDFQENERNHQPHKQTHD